MAGLNDAFNDAINQQAATFGAGKNDPGAEGAGNQQQQEGGQKQQHQPVADPNAQQQQQKAGDNSQQQNNATAAAFDEKGYLKTNFGYESLDEVKQKFSGLAQLEEQNKTFATRTTELESELSDFKKSGEVGALFVKAINSGVNPKLVAEIFDVKEDQLTDEAAVKLYNRLTKPHLNNDDIDVLYKRDFDVSDADLDPTVKRLKEVALKDEGVKARSGLKDFIGKTLTPVQQPDPAAEKAARDAEYNKRLETWGSHVPKLSNGLKELVGTLGLQTFGAEAGKLTDVPVKYVVPEARLNEIMAEAQKAAAQQGIVPDEQGIKAVQEYASRLMWARFGADIAKAYAADAVTFVTTEFEKAFTGRRPANTGTEGGRQTNANPNMSDAEAAFAAQFGSKNKDNKRF